MMLYTAGDIVITRYSPVRLRVIRAVEADQAVLVEFEADEPFKGARTFLYFDHEVLPAPPQLDPVPVVAPNEAAQQLLADEATARRRLAAKVKLLRETDGTPWALAGDDCHLVYPCVHCQKRDALALTDKSQAQRGYHKPCDSCGQWNYVEVSLAMVLQVVEVRLSKPTDRKT